MIPDRIQRLREAMQAGNVQACIIPTTDPHIGEYTPDCWKTRRWISGFTGSAGTVLVTTGKAGLWTDSRYFLQAEEELRGTGIDLFKAGLPGTPSPEEWLSAELSPGDTVGFEGAVFAASEALALIASFNSRGIRVNPAFAPYDRIWDDRPPKPHNEPFILPESFAGKSVRSKIECLREEMRKLGGNLTLLASLDMIAWLFNLRGTDIPYNPVALAYALVSEKEARLFVQRQKLSPAAAEYLREQGVTLDDYGKTAACLAACDAHDTVVIAPDKINYHLYTSIPDRCKLVKVPVHPVDFLKAVKNETERSGFRRAMQTDGVALVKFLCWLDKQLATGQPLTELEVSDRLSAFRKESEAFFGESFETIAAYGAHGAIVHYAARPETNASILPEGVLLLDSGGHYPYGTTDITRTLATGPVSDEMKRDYTLVLKGNIQLSRAVFPKGTVGMQLDVLARQFLWKAGQNFLHGTGHGVGHFLNVHEGPQSIRMNYNPNPLLPGMVVSNEPGIYKAGRYGIRIENLLLVVPYETAGDGEYCAFEVLTLCPIDTRLIDRSLMSVEEIRWLDDYHQKVYRQLSPLLPEEEKEWLKSTLKKD
ncbi:MAG: aminopeptidase P family protein [Dysgonamonadaceae bacterium]|nr:aminopeptidase P family protein [Dysgonamonadaceae bacterium]